jgi:hypothetical protein
MVCGFSHTIDRKANYHEKILALTIILTVLSLAVKRLCIATQYCSLCLSQGYDFLVASPEYFSAISIVPGLF